MNILPIIAANESGGLAGSVEQLISQLRATVDELHQLHQELEAEAQHQDEEQRLRIAFLGRMSEALRPPQNSIISFSQAILEHLDDPPTPAQEENLSLIYESGQYLLRIMMNMLDIARIETGKLVLNFTTVDLKPIIAEVMDDARDIALAKPLTCIIDIPRPLPPIHTDVFRVSQILHSLVSNAVKYTEQGQVTLTAFTQQEKENATRPEPDAPDWVVIQVQDTGIGISPDSLEDIFQGYSRADKAQMTLYDGTSLELPVTRRLVRLLGGSIGVNSRLGKGSTFTVHLPVRPEPRNGA